jgi:hypothetical protein
MLTRRRVLCLFALIALMGALLFWQFRSGAPRSSLRPDQFPQVRVGMTQAEVETLLGGPPGNYGRHRNGMTMMTLEGFIAPPGSVERVWCDDSHRFEIYFDAKGIVVAHHRRAGYSQEPGEGILGWIRRVVGI